MCFWPVVLLCGLEHGTVQQNGQTYRMKDSINNILQGLEFEDFTKFTFDSEFWTHLQEGLDPTGEKRALKTLNMTEFVGKSDAYTEADVKQHFKQMARAHHPDRAAPADKASAEQKMAEINKAKEVLDGILKGRS